MMIDAETGWISGVRRVASPNFDARPCGAELELVVVHGISLPPGQFGGSHIDQLFTNALRPDEHPYFAAIAGARVSSHVLIDRHGQLTQYVSFLDRAWHAGESAHFGRSGCNDFSVGIELEGTDEIPYEPEQYAALAKTVHALRTAYPSLARAQLVGHCHIAPGRKTDPGPAFEWLRLGALLQAR
jgi:AmpD protein